MTKYRKKPIVIDAFRWTKDDFDEPDWFMDAMVSGCIFFLAGTPHGLAIHTPEGAIGVSHGDYIIRGIKGEIYPCKPDIFLQTYDEVDEFGECIDAWIANKDNEE